MPGAACQAPQGGVRGEGNLDNMCAREEQPAWVKVAVRLELVALECMQHRSLVADHVQVYKDVPCEKGGSETCDPARLPNQHMPTHAGDLQVIPPACPTSRTHAGDPARLPNQQNICR